MPARASVGAMCRPALSRTSQCALAALNRRPLLVPLPLLFLDNSNYLVIPELRDDPLDRGERVGDLASASGGEARHVQDRRWSARRGGRHAGAPPLRRSGLRCTVRSTPIHERSTFRVGPMQLVRALVPVFKYPEIRSPNAPVWRRSNLGRCWPSLVRTQAGGGPSPAPPGQYHNLL